MTDISSFDKEFGYTRSGIADIKKIDRLYKKSVRKSSNTAAVNRAIKKESLPPAR